MGLFGGGNSSTSNQYQTNNIKKDQVIGNGAIGLANEGNNNTTTVSVLDGGAIAGALNFAKDANSASSDNYARLLNTTSSALDSIIGGQNDGLRNLISAQNSGLSSILNGVASAQNFIAATSAQATGQLDNRTKLYLGVGMLAVVAFIAWSGKK